MDRTHRLGPDIPHVAVSQKTCDAAAENTKWREGRDVLSDDPLVWRTKRKTSPLLTGGHVDFCLFKKKSPLVALLHRIKRRRTNSPTWRASASTAQPQTTRRGQFVVKKKSSFYGPSIHQIFTFLLGYNLF